MHFCLLALITPSVSAWFSKIRCSHYDDFRYCHKCPVDQLPSQGYIALRLEKSFMKSYDRYQDPIEKYQRSVKVMMNDSFLGQFLFNMQQEFSRCCHLDLSMLKLIAGCDGRHA